MSQPPQPPPNQPPPGECNDPYRPHPAAQHGQPQPGQQPPGQQPPGQYGPQPGSYGQQPDAYGPPPGGYPQGPYGPGGYQQPGGYQHGGEPQYPVGGYGAAPEPANQGLTINLGARLRRRPEPRFGISLAAAGIAIVIVGIAVWSVGYLVEGIHFSLEGGFAGSGRRFLGFGLSLILVLLGYALAVTRKNGPLATAGAVGAAVGVPLALIFVTFDLASASGGLPANTDLVYILSVIVYLASYFFVPGMRGRSFLLALAALLFVGYIELKVASDSIGRASVTIFAGGSGLDSGDFGTGALTAVALIFGLLYIGAAIFLDLRGMHGGATAMVVAGTNTLVGGIGYGVLTFKQVGTGIELVILGLVLSYYGARFARRFTTWFWMFAMVVGFGLLVQKATPDSPAGAGITLIVIGLVVVGLAQVATTVLHEGPDILDETPSDDVVPAAGSHRH